MIDLLTLAQRLEAACDITGKPIGRHMVDSMRQMSTALAEMGDEGDDDSRHMSEVISTLAVCIGNEATLFDDLAAVAKEAVGALRSLGIPRDISTAPDGDGWILGYDPSITEDHRSPWLSMTRCDCGWADDGVDTYQPTMWVPLPDPQPKRSGWRPAEGHIEIAAGKMQGKPIFIATVIKPDGTQDVPRDAMLSHSAEGIRAEAESWAKQLGLPVVDTIDANVVPFKMEEPQS
jgi:hypothetical protein